MIKKKCIAFWLGALLLSACQLNQDIDYIEEGESKLIVQWPNHHSWNEKLKARVYLYDSEQAWSSPHGSPVASASLADKHPTSKRGIPSVNWASFEGLPSKKYWIKILNEFHENKLIEHNQNLPHILETPLQRGTVTTTTLHTQRYTLQEYRVRSLTVNKLQAIAANPNRQVKVTIRKFYRNSNPGPPPTIFYEALVSTNNFPLEIKNLDIPIREFSPGHDGPFFYLTITSPSFPIYENEEIRVFDLIIENAGVYDPMMHKHQQHELIYTITGDWLMQE